MVSQLLSQNEKRQLENEEKAQDIPVIDINARSLDGWTALHYAVSEGHYPIVDALLKAKAKPDLTTSMKRTPLHIACLRNNLPIVELLTKHPSVDVNFQDSDFNTPLHIAAERGLIEIVQFLLDNKADPKIENHQKKTAYDLTLS